MLGMVEDDLRQAIGIDTKPLWSQWTMYGFKNQNFKPFMTPWGGQEVLVAQDFNTTENDENVYIYAGGDKSYEPAGGVMPKSGYFFDSPNRQKPFTDNDLNPEDNLEEFGYISVEDLDYYKEMKKSLRQ